MGDNNRPTVRIGNTTNGDVSGSVTHTCKVKIEVGGAHNFVVGDCVQGNVKKGAKLAYSGEVEQTIATEMSQSNQEPSVKDHQILDEENLC